MLLASAEYADAHFSTRMEGERWDAQTSATRAKALQSASDLIERHVAQNGGWKTAPTDGNVPEAVKNACCAEALALLDQGAERRRDLRRAGVTSASMGGASESYGNAAEPTLRSEAAADLLRPYLRGMQGRVSIL